MPLLVTIALIVVLLSFLIIIHELGHYLAAKWMNIKVEEFGLGYPPRAKLLFHKWGTDFTLNYTPLGGFVRIYGDDSESIEKGLEIPPDTDPAELPEYRNHAFSQKPIWQRAVVLLGGVAVNFLFGALAFAAIYTKVGIPEPYGYVKVTAIEEGAPASQTALAVDDVLIGFRDREQTVVTPTNAEFTGYIAEHLGQEVTIVYQRNREEQSVPLRLRTKEEIPAGGGAMGVGIEDTRFVFYPLWQRPFRGIVVGTSESLKLGLLIVRGLGEMVGQIFTRGQIPDELSGPIGIVSETQKSGILEDGWLGRLNWMALISVNLAIMNLLPIPALDGGRTLFLLLEPVLGSDRRLRWERQANYYGMLFLLGMIVLISLKDIWKIFR